MTFDFDINCHNIVGKKNKRSDQFLIEFLAILLFKKSMDKEKVADFLVKEGYLLTALELHVELTEKGKTLPFLTKYFEDSKNFEAFTTRSASSPQVGFILFFVDLRNEEN